MSELVSFDQFQQRPFASYAPVEFANLTEHPEYLAALAACHQAQWRGMGSPVSLLERQQRLSTHLLDAGFPATWLALQHRQLVGSVSLVNYAGQTDSSLWMANLYVEPAFRQLGIGTQLVNLAARMAEQAGFPELKLFTADQQPFYRQRQWQHCYETRVQGQWVDVMRLPLIAC